jgi:hypothetical protein
VGVGLNLAVVVSDLHCGSTVGLLPPGLHTADGTEMAQNAVQRWIWECWEKAHHFAESVCGDDPFDLIVNGDLIEGLHHGSKQVISQDIGDHIAAAVEALKPLASKAANVHLTVGTECHTQNAEHGIGKALNASVNPATRRHVHDRLLLDFNGLLLSASHHTSATSRQWLESGEYSRAISSERLSCARTGWRLPDIFLRAHRHVSGCYTDFSSMMLVTGAWQLMTRHTFKVVPGAICEPTIAILDARDCEPGELPRVRCRKFSPPEPALAA